MDLIEELEGHWGEKNPGWDCEERALLSDGTRRGRAWVSVSVDLNLSSRQR